jgi:hypothetical protein
MPEVPVSILAKTIDTVLEISKGKKQGINGRTMGKAIREDIRKLNLPRFRACPFMGTSSHKSVKIWE